MDNLLMNLLRVSAGTTLLYVLYLLFFQKDTFYLRNRIILILTLLLPTILPVLKIPIAETASVEMPVNVLENVVFQGAVTESIISSQVNSFDYYRLLEGIYFTITALLLIRIAVSLISTFRIIRKGTVKNNQFPRIILSCNGLPPFSFFPYAVIPEEDYMRDNYNVIIDHEFAHLRQGHTFDLLLGELFIAFQWFNPLVWLIKRSIVLNHEYLADQYSLRNNRRLLEYQYRLLNFQPGLKNVSLAHNFNSLIKNRIIMINKKRTGKYAILKNVLILPVVAFVVYAFATPEYIYVNPPSQPFEIYMSAASKQELPQAKSQSSPTRKPGPIVIIDGIISDKTPAAARKELGYNMGIGKNLSAKTATEKYGEKGANGAYEITTRKKALEMGLKPPFPRLSPDDYPTFQNQNRSGFREWVASQVKYPAEAQTKKIEGWVSVKFVVGLDGSLSKVENSGKNDPILSNEIIRAVQSSPKWEAPKNRNVDEPYSTSITVGFKLPDLITTDVPYVVVDEMPRFPGGDVALLDFISKNIKYPEAAKTKGIQGKVIMRFSINKDGNAEDFSILRGVDPLLDAEALKVGKLLPKFKPGKQDGKPVSVWYMVPISFTLK